MFRGDKQRRAMFAAMNSFSATSAPSVKFSKGRAPKIGELVYVPGDSVAGVTGGEGRVVGVHSDYADVQFGFGKDAFVDDMGFEEFEDQQSIKDAKKSSKKENSMSWNPESLDKYNAFNIRARDEKKQGHPIEKLREEFIDEMSEFVLEQGSDESRLEYVNRSKEEKMLTVDELEFLSKTGYLRK